MNNKLDGAQFIVIVRTPTFQDSRCPFVDVAAVAHQRDLRRVRVKRLRFRERLKKRQQQLIQQQAAQQQPGSSSNKTPQQQQHPQQQLQQLMQSVPPYLLENDDEDENAENEEDMMIGDEKQQQQQQANNKKAAASMQRLLSPTALFGNFCIVNGVSQVCEHLLRCYENEVMADRSRKVVAAREKQQQQHDARMKEQQAKEEKEKQNKLKRQQQQHQQQLLQSGSVGDLLVGGVGHSSASASLSVALATAAATAAEQERQQQQEQQKQEQEKQQQKSEEELWQEEEAEIDAELDKQFASETDELSTAYPLSGVPAHYQYDGNLLFKFLESLPMCAVFELDDENVSEEPRYIPHGLLWVKAQLLLFMEARAKTIEAPQEVN